MYLLVFVCVRVLKWQKIKITHECSFISKILQDGFKIIGIDVSLFISKVLIWQDLWNKINKTIKDFLHHITHKISGKPCTYASKLGRYVYKKYAMSKW